MDGLYHCTTCDSLVKILEKRAFYPSYCLEEASYLKSNPKFAFAMVCFADLQKHDVKRHMKNFSSDVYIKMKKEWVVRYNVSPVVYYSEKSTLSNAIFRDLTMHAVKKGEKGTVYNSLNLLMGLMKQYKGHYFDKKRNQISSNEVCFYLEREWRYLPLVTDEEAYFLSEEDYHDEEIRRQKRQELIEHAYVLDFSWDDIIEIGVEFNNLFPIINTLSTIFKKSRSKVISKIKII